MRILRIAHASLTPALRERERALARSSGPEGQPTAIHREEFRRLRTDGSKVASISRATSQNRLR